jgi:hypothetical protein
MEKLLIWLENDNNFKYSMWTISIVMIIIFTLIILIN